MSCKLSISFYSLLALAVPNTFSTYFKTRAMQSLALTTFLLTIKAAIGNRECPTLIETFKIAIYIPFLMSSANLSCLNVPSQHISLLCRPYPSRDSPLIRLRFTFNPKAKIGALHRVNESGNPFRRHFIHSRREFFQSSKQ